MTELKLIDIDNNDKVVAVVAADGDKIAVTGPSADVARSIVENRARLLDEKPGAILDKLADYGWSNGHLALVRK